MRQSKAYRRRGSMYVAVLGCALVVAVIGLSALTVTRIERSYADATADFARSRLYAQSAIEMGMLRIRNDPEWRTTYPSGVWETDRPIGEGTYTLEGIDPDDNNLKDRDTDPVVLTGTGVRGDTQYKLQVILVADTEPLTCLEVSLQAGNDAIFQDPATVSGNQIISANNTIQAVGSCTINPDCEAVNGFVGAITPGSKTSGITPRTMPDSATVFDYYITNGTLITVPDYRIDKHLISPASNPFGPTTNSQGIYVVDCQSQNIVITKSRIVGTLVLLNTGANSEIKPSVYWEPAVANFPVLLVDGTLKMDVGSTDLTESAAINFNPPGTPYEGAEDGDLDDSYPPIIKGLVYIRNDLFTANSVAIEGVLVVGNTLTSTGVLELNYRQTYLDEHPPGFGATTRMVVSQGTWRQVVD